jgi:hypothetical protein
METCQELAPSGFSCLRLCGLPVEHQRLRSPPQPHRRSRKKKLAENRAAPPTGPGSRIRVFRWGRILLRGQGCPLPSRPAPRVATAMLASEVFDRRPLELHGSSAGRAVRAHVVTARSWWTTTSRPVGSSRIPPTGPCFRRIPSGCSTGAWPQRRVLASERRRRVWAPARASSRATSTVRVDDSAD